MKKYKCPDCKKETLKLIPIEIGVEIYRCDVCKENFSQGVIEDGKRILSN